MDKEEIIEKLLAGEMKLYQIDKYTQTATEALDIRREFIEKYSDCKLDQISNYTLDMELAFAKNIEKSYRNHTSAYWCCRTCNNQWGTCKR